jgi:hypothetical protein
VSGNQVETLFCKNLTANLVLFTTRYSRLYDSWPEGRIFSRVTQKGPKIIIFLRGWRVGERNGGEVWREMWVNYGVGGGKGSQEVKEAVK